MQLKSPNIPRFPLFLLVILLYLQYSNGILVEEVVVPSVVKRGQTVELKCRYKEVDKPLYSLKWWRNEDQFYQFIPPKRSYFEAPGVKVNMTATTNLNKHSSKWVEKIILEDIGLDSAGIYKCEVMADIIFQTEFMQANMTVISIPDGTPKISGPKLGRNNKLSVHLGDMVTLNCTIPPSTPPPILTWLINNKPVSNIWVTDNPIIEDREGMKMVSSNIRIPISDAIIDPHSNYAEISCVGTQGEWYKHRDIKTLELYQPSIFGFFSHGCMTKISKILVFTCVTSAILHFMRK